MKRETTHEMRALLLASLMVLSVVGGAVGAVGSVGATNDLETSDGSGGTYSFLFANFTDELPEGEQSGDDTLQVETAQVGETLDNNFYASVTLQGEEIQFNTDQSTDDVEAVVYNGATEEEIRVDDIGSDRVELAVEYDGSTFDDGPQGIRINNLSFDTGSTENATLKWTLEEGQTDSVAKYELRVTSFQTDVVATDEEGGDGASLTAGAANQTMVSDDGANNPVLQGNDSSASFPEQFQATLSLEGQNVSFDEANADRVSAVSPNGDAEVVSVGSDEVVVSVSGFEPPTTIQNYDVVELQGLTYVVPADANSETLTWSVGDKEGTYELAAERLEAGIEGDHEFPRGLDQQPEAEDDLSEDGITVTVDASGKNTDGFHDADREFYVFIPEAHQGDLEFDRSADPNGTLSADNSLEESNVLVNVRDEDTLWVTLPEDIDGGETLAISGVTFNTTGIEESEIGESDFESGLDVEYEPVDSLERFERSTGSDALNVTVPQVDVEGDSTAFAPKQDIEGANGTDELAVKVQDVTGGQMAGDEDIVISLAGDDAITFNQSQDLVAKNNIDGDGRRKVDIVSPYEIRIRGDDIFSDTSEDEYHKLEAESGTGIKFDVDAANAGGSANLTVRTSPGDASVTQLTQAVVTIEPANMTVDPKRLRAHGSENETITVEVNEPGDVSAEGVEVSVATAELPEGVSLPESATTNGDGKATFDLERNTNETVTLEFAANASDIDGAQEDLTEEVKVVAPGLFPNTETIPVGQESEVEVTVKRFDDKSGQLEPVGNGDVTVFADGDSLSDDSETTAETNANGVATFTLNATDESEIEFNADVDDVDVEEGIRAVRAEIKTSQSTLPVGDSDPVEVTVVNVTQEGDEKTVSGVDVYATSEDVDLNVGSPKNTRDDGSVTFDFDLQEVGVIKLNTTLDDGTELETTVETVDIGTNVSKVPAGKETTVAVEVDGSEGVNVDGGTVTAISDAIEDDSADIENGVATFTFTPNNAEDASIDFETTVDGAGLETSVDSVAPRLKTDPGAINLGAEEEVTVTVEAYDADTGQMEPRNVSVSATSEEFDVDDERWTDDGRTTFTIDLTDEDESGSIAFDASVDGIALSETVAAEHFDVGVSGGPLTEGESGTLTVSITPSGESAEGFTVVAAGDPLDEPVEADDVGDGEYELTLKPDAAGEITVNVEELGETRVVEVEEASSGSAGGGGGGGFYGGGGGALPADISAVDASLAATETVVAEPVEVTVTLRNDGGGDGTYDVRVGDGIRTYGSETVDVGAGETVEVVVEAVFPNSGEFDLVVDDVEVGTVVVEPATDAPDIENAAALDTRPVEDAAPDEPGVTVVFEDVTVDSITFGSDADGSATVADLEALPADVPAAPGSLVRPMEIRVPDELSDEPATVRFSVSLVDIDGDMDNVALARYTDGGWESYQPEVIETRGDEVVYEVETPGFSTFAVYEQQQESEDPSATATPDEDVEESGFVGPLGMMVIAFVALLAVLLAVAGARVYKESGP